MGAFLQELGPGVPERYDDFASLHNRLVSWALRQQNKQAHGGRRAEPAAEQQAEQQEVSSVGSAGDALQAASLREEP